MLNQEEINLYIDVSNPLDCVEDIMIGRDWVFERLNEDELTVQVSGKFGHYSMAFVWQEDVNALQFSAQIDTEIHASKMDEAQKIMSQINAGLWLGHFDMAKGSSQPSFRHTSLFRGMTEGSGAPYIEDLIQIGLAECERYFMTFDLLSKASSQENIITSHSDMDLAMMDVYGVA